MAGDFKVVSLMAYLAAGLKCIVPGIILGIGSYIILSNSAWKGKDLSLSEKLKMPVALGYFLSLELVVLISRGSMGESFVNIYPFEALRTALADGSAAAFWQYALNILMFVPCGFVLCWLFDGKFKKAIAAVVLIPVCNELIQYLGVCGVADVDDLIANTLGGLWGCAIFAFVLALKNKSGAARYGYINLSVLLVIAMLTALYLGKPYGYLPSDFINSQHIRPDTVDCSAIENELPKELGIYTAVEPEIENADSNAAIIFEAVGRKLSEEQMDAYENLSVYWARRSNTVLWYWHDGAFDLNIPEGVAVESREAVSELLKEMGYAVPEGLVFRRSGTGKFSADCDLVEADGVIYDGFVYFEYLDGKLYSLSYHIKELIPAGTYEALDADALEKNIRKGRFGTEKELDDIGSIEILDYSLDYIMDGKGYYRPVYIMQADMDGTELELTVSAQK